MELIVIIKNVFGNDAVYPQCDKGKLLAEFKGQKTFTRRDVDLLKKLGYIFKVEQEIKSL